MNKFKLFISTAALSLFFTLQAFAATGQISFSDPSVTLGSDVNVTMKVKSGDGTLSRADITVNYDASLIEFQSGTDAEGGAGTVRIHGASNGANTGVLEYNLKFKTLSAGTAAIKIASQEVYDTDESMVEITHSGSSTVTIASQNAASTNAQLSSLQVSPGTLTPEFSSDITAYDVIVGTDVNTLAINAIAADQNAKVTVTGNDSLNMGENNVAVVVTAPDGATQATYNIKVTKQEGGPSADDALTNTETRNEGVKLSSKEKTITIMNPGSDVTIPTGFAESTIDIDGHQVKGWVWKQDTEHKYCIVYGMNDAGELNFYRYDLQEKTIQRYFADPVEAELQANAEKYPELVQKYDSLVTQYNHMFILCCALGVSVLALLVFIIVVLSNGRNSHKTDSPHKKIPSATPEKEPQPEKDDVMDETIPIKTLRHKSTVSPQESDMELTKVITKAKAARPSDLSSKSDLSSNDSTIVINDLHIENASDEPTIAIPSLDADAKKKEAEENSGLDFEDL